MVCLGREDDQGLAVREWGCFDWGAVSQVLREEALKVISVPVAVQAPRVERMEPEKREQRCLQVYH